MSERRMMETQFISVTAARLELLKSHLVDNQAFLNQEILTVNANLKATFEKIDVLSKQLFNARFRVLESRLLAVNGETSRNLTAGSRDMLFRIDKELLLNVVNNDSQTPVSPSQHTLIIDIEIRN
ncbi:hypothetical protein HK100_007657, partial [Physocladia obscura]